MSLMTILMTLMVNRDANYIDINMEADIKEFEYKNGYWIKW